MPQRYLQAGFVYHTISATFRRQRTFANAQNAQAVMDAIRFVRLEGRAHVLAFAVMPDHLHLLLAPRDGARLPVVMHTVKSHSAHEINRRLGSKGKIWQQGYYDRVIRDYSQLEATTHYIHQNAVEAGLCKAADEYLFSSAHSADDVDVVAFFGDASS